MTLILYAANLFAKAYERRFHFVSGNVVLELIGGAQRKNDFYKPEFLVTRVHTPVA